MDHRHVSTAPGESAPFHFDNLWRVNASPAAVWQVLTRVEAWPQWWPGLPVAEPADDTVAPGSRAHLLVTSPIGLSLDFDIELRDIRTERFAGFTATGDLRGVGEWSLSRNGPITTIESTWCVTTTRRSIRLLRPLAARLHDSVMRAGERGLAAHLAQEPQRP